MLFSYEHRITGADAGTLAFTLMALAMVTSELCPLMGAPILLSPRLAPVVRPRRDVLACNEALGKLSLPQLCLADVELCVAGRLEFG